MTSQKRCITTPTGGHACDATAASSWGSATSPDWRPGTTTECSAWLLIVQVLDKLLVQLRNSHMPQPLVHMLFRQLFSFINVVLINQVLLSRDSCTRSVGEYVNKGLAQVRAVSGLVLAMQMLLCELQATSSIILNIIFGCDALHRP